MTRRIQILALSLPLAIAACAGTEPNRLDLIELDARAETDPAIRAALDEYYDAIRAKDQKRFEAAKAALVKMGGGR